MFNVINSSIVNNFTINQDISRTPKNSQGQKSVFQGSRIKPLLMANSRKVLGTQRRLATLCETKVGNW